jgi:hypothetical protein
LNLQLPLFRIFRKVYQLVVHSNVVKSPFHLVFLNPEWKPNELLGRFVLLQMHLGRIHSVLWPYEIILRCKII